MERTRRRRRVIGGSGGAHSTPDGGAWWSELDASGGKHGGANSTPAVAGRCTVERTRRRQRLIGGSGGAHSTPDDGAGGAHSTPAVERHGGANSTPAGTMHSGAHSTLAKWCTVERTRHRQRSGRSTLSTLRTTPFQKSPSPITISRAKETYDLGCRKCIRYAQSINSVQGLV